MNNIATKGIVLRRINYQEADRILIVITSDQGKLSLLARGVRKSNSKLAGSIELFGTSHLTYIRGRGELGTLISARIINHYQRLGDNLERIQLCYQLMKLISKYVEDTEGGEFYNLLDRSFQALDDPNTSDELVRFWFMLNFLHLTGHSPNTQLSDGSKSQKYIFDLDSMSFAPHASGTYEANHLKLFRLAVLNGPDKLRRIVGVAQLIEPLNNLITNIMRKNGFEVN